METTNNLFEGLKRVKKATYCKVVTLTVANMNKTNNPYYGTKKITIFSSCKLGIDYANLMDSCAKKSMGEQPTEHYKVSTNTGKGDWIEGLEKLVTRNDKGAEYLHIFIEPTATKKYTAYLYNNQLITTDNPLFEQIRFYDKSANKKNICSKQENHGIEQNKLTSLITVKCENVIEVFQKETLYENVSLEKELINYINGCN